MHFINDVLFLLHYHHIYPDLSIPTWEYNAPIQGSTQCTLNAKRCLRYLNIHVVSISIS